MPITTTFEELNNFVNSNSEQLKTANQLWKENGRELNIPFKEWLTQQILLAKSSNWYKTGMSIGEMVQGNKQNSQIDDVETNIDTEKVVKTKEDFKLLGANGYLVLGLIIVTAVGGYYLYKKQTNKK